ncbi:MAG TPA: DNA repair protein RadC [Syntrophorhabdales bacterium]|nr:DNA repair protein RadC [Syntrophorhabdales bacterium]
MSEPESSFTIHDLPVEERPRERLKRLGPRALSGPELLALVIGRGVAGKSAIIIAQELLRRFKNIRGVSEATLEELSGVAGIGPAKAAQLKACFELGRRQDQVVDKPSRYKYELTSPHVVVKAVRATIQDKAKEHFKLVLLNVRNVILDISTISVGTANASLVHPREVFKKAIAHSASSVVLAHNHPSGNAEPSEDDVKLTQRLVEAGRLLGIEVLDHIIVTATDEFVSFKERGLL